MSKLNYLVGLLLLCLLVKTQAQCSVGTTNTIDYSLFTDDATYGFPTITSVFNGTDPTNASAVQHSKSSYTTSGCSGNEITVDLEYIGFNWQPRTYVVSGGATDHEGKILMRRVKGKQSMILSYTFSSPVVLNNLLIEEIDNGEGVYVISDKDITITETGDTSNLTITGSASTYGTIVQTVAGNAGGNIALSSTDAITQLTIVFGVDSGNANISPEVRQILVGEISFCCDTSFSCNAPTFSSDSSSESIDLSTLTPTNTDAYGATTVTWYASEEATTALSSTTVSSGVYYASFSSSSDTRCRTAYTVVSDADQDSVNIETDQDNDNDGILNTAEQYCDASTNPNAIVNSANTLTVDEGLYKNQYLFFDLSETTIDENTTFPIEKSITYNGTTYKATITQVDFSQAIYQNRTVVQRPSLTSSNVYASYTYNGVTHNDLYAAGWYYDVNGNTYQEVFNTSSFLGNIYFSVTISAEVGGISYPVEVIVFDGEHSSGGDTNSNESQTITTTGTDFVRLEEYASVSDITDAERTQIASGKELAINQTDTYGAFWATEGVDVSLNYHLKQIGQRGVSGIGFAVRPYCDTDGDGTPNFLDLDSDNDGCVDAVEGGDDISYVVLSDDLSDTATAGTGSSASNLNLGTTVDTNGDGIPTTVSSSGQTIGNSQDASVDTCVCERDGTSGTPRATDVGVSTLDRNVETWLPNNLGAYLATESTTKGFVITRNSDPENNISNAVEGMMVWDTTDKCLKLYDGTSWNCIEQGCSK